MGIQYSRGPEDIIARDKIVAIFKDIESGNSPVKYISASNSIIELFQFLFSDKVGFLQYSWCAIPIISDQYLPNGSWVEHLTDGTMRYHEPDSTSP